MESQNQQPTTPQPVASPQPPAPLEQIECWYIPEGQYTIFAYRKCVVVFYPGWMMIYRKSDNVEVGRIQLAPDLRMKYFLNFVRIAQLNGKKHSVFKLNNNFMTASIWLYSVFLLGLVVNLISSFGRLNGEPNPGLQLLAVVLILGGLGLLATGMPKAKALVAAAKRAAGIAS